MNIMSLDAAYGAGTMQELHQANEDHDYGHGQGNQSATQLQQVPHRAPPAPTAPAAPVPPGRHVVAQYPPPPPPTQAPQPLAPLPPMPSRQMPPPPPMAPPPGMRGPAPQPHANEPLPFHPNQRPMQPAPLRDQRFVKLAKPTTGADVKAEQKSSFVENHKVLIIVFVVIICLVLGVLVAVLATQARKKKAGALMGGTLTEFGMPALGGGGGGTTGGVPQYVGGVEFGGHLSSLPNRAWNESASAFLRR